ncbi:bacteriohemerythrin [Solidesulfovibrio alcoholivorans]|uniref:bacteriohemerythrin n=1 Tax=Solidesulfovibrio alcoholivorans TaxID=81406 RepID=UPI000497AA10|nr:bacteriohemerythrin [Solidesulfovibrio alcoholivorans]
MSIRLQILCSLGVMFLLSCVMFVPTWRVYTDQRADGETVALTKVQRDSAHQIAKDAVVQARRGVSGKDASGWDAAFRPRFEALERAEAVLTKGGVVSAGSRTFHIQEPEAEAAAHYADVNRLIKAFAADVAALSSNSDDAAVEKVMTSSEALTAALDKALDTVLREDQADLGRLMLIEAVCLGVGAVVFLLVLAALGRTLKRPLDRLRAFAAAVAGGDLKAAPEGEYPLELGELRDALAHMVTALEANMAEARSKGAEAERHAAEADQALEAAKVQEARTNELLATLHDAAGKARNVSESMMDSSGSLLAQAEQVAGGARHQRDRMIETATAMEEMNATVLEVARNASSAAASADEAKSKAVTGAEGVRSAVASIENIRQRILELRESMTLLGQKADNIGHIMNVISDIADQTNLLALNAAIEAARAGDAGRGFAVVADEVRKLAEKTMTATKEVGDAVASIQGQARENIAAVESAAAGIEESTQAAASSGRFMDEIVGIVEATASQVESIATASEEQSATSEEINRAVEEVNRIAEDTASGMETATAALSALSSLAEELDDVIRRMTGEQGTARRVPAAPRAVAAASRQPLPSARPAARSLPAAAHAKPKAKPLPVASRPAPSRALPAAKPAAPVSRPAAAKSAAGNGDPAACSIGSAILQWDQSLAVNIGDIDEQHQKLVQMICDLHEAMRTGKGKGQVESILRELEEYAVEHFGFEEKLMEKHKYPGYLNHRKEHEKFVDQVIAFGNDFRANRAALTTEVMNFLKNWLVGHIKGTDKKYSSFFNERGVH